MKLAKKIFNAIAGKDDPTKPKESKPLEKWDGMVEKKDGTIGKWGNDWPEQKKPDSRLSPSGSMTDDQKKYLESLKDKKVDQALSRKIQGEKQTEQYGDSDSDMFKQILKNKPVTLPKMAKK